MAILIWGLIGLLSLMLGLGEPFFLISYGWLPFFAWRKSESRGLRWFALSACSALMLLHLVGFKIYGREEFADLEPLHQPRTLVALQPPSTLVFADGTRTELGNLWFPQPVHFLNDVTNYNGVHMDSFGIYLNGLRLSTTTQEKVEVELVQRRSGGTRVICQLRGLRERSSYLFPRLRPRKKRSDFGTLLVSRGAALPTIAGLETEREYGDQLLQVAGRGGWGAVTPGHDRAITFAKRLMEVRPEQFVLGATLLVNANDTNSFPILIAEIRKLRNDAPVTLAEVDSGWSPLTDLFLHLEPVEARRVMDACVTEKRTNGVWLTYVAACLARHGDWSGFDFTMREQNRPDAPLPYRQMLTLQHMSWFQFFKEVSTGHAVPTPLGDCLAEWYAEVRPELKWVAVSGEQPGFTLADGKPFDARYYDSMNRHRTNYHRRLGFQ